MYLNIGRRYVAPGLDVNTGKFEAQKVQIADIRDRKSDYSLSNCGFQLVDHESKIPDFRNEADANSLYLREMEELITITTGASKVVAFSAIVRAAAQKDDGYIAQPPAIDVHCDYNTKSAKRVAERLLTERGISNTFKSFSCINAWRAISPGPQDFPLAVCDARTADKSEDYSNIMVVVDDVKDIPDLSDLDNLEPLDDKFRPEAVLYPYTPGQKWYYFSNMNAHEVLLFKLFDSRPDPTALRCPHCAFDNSKVEGAVLRESVEVRMVAYFD